MLVRAQQQEVGLPPNQLEHERGGAVLLVFAVEAEHPLVGVGLRDRHQGGVAQVFAHEQEQRRLALHPAAQLVLDQVSACRIGCRAEQQLVPGAVRVHLQPQAVVVHQQGALDTAGAEGGLQLGAHAGSRQGIKLHQRASGGRGSSFCWRQARAITFSRCCIVPPAAK